MGEKRNQGKGKGKAPNLRVVLSRQQHLTPLVSEIPIKADGPRGNTHKVWLGAAATDHPDVLACCVRASAFWKLLWLALEEVLWERAEQLDFKTIVWVTTPATARRIEAAFGGG